MKIEELFNGKKQTEYIRVVESRNNKGIETYFDTEKLENLNPIYKEQLLSVFISGINVLSQGSLTVVRVQTEEEIKPTK